jgi:hypothetical protein
MVAAFELGLETIKSNWRGTLEYMSDTAVEFGQDLPNKLVGMGKGKIGGGKWNQQTGEVTITNTVESAQKRFDDLMAKLNERPGAQPAPEQMSQKPDIKNAVVGLWESMQKPSADIQTQSKQLIDTKLAQAAPMAGMLKGWFDGVMNQEPKKQESFQSLSAAKAGSSEALSTVMYSAFRQRNNPQVQAVDKQTKQQAKQHSELMNVLKDGGLAMMGGWP